MNMQLELKINFIMICSVFQIIFGIFGTYFYSIQIIEMLFPFSFQILLTILLWHGLAGQM